MQRREETCVSMCMKLWVGAAAPHKTSMAAYTYNPTIRSEVKVILSYIAGLSQPGIVKTLFQKSKGVKKKKTLSPLKKIS